MGRLEAICIAEETGQPKRPVPQAEFVGDHGIAGDAHAGAWHRQVSLLAAEDVQAVRGKIPDIGPGDFAENLVTAGVDLAAVGLGSRLRIGADVILRVTQLGKDCHTPCRIGRITGDCILPRRGVFARVLAGGRARPGDAVEIIQLVPRQAFQVVVLTISDRCSRGQAQDTAGPAATRLLAEDFGACVYTVEVIPDDRATIAGRLKHYCDGHSIDLVVTVGGTGFSPRDVTPEATAEVIDRPAPGLAEAMRAASLGKTANAMLSRGVCGLRKQTLIVNLPGSQRGAVENLAVILPALGHGLTKLRGDGDDCGRPA